MASIVGEASSSSPPSTSIPPPQQSYTYHVFLSFSGKDTRNGLTGHLLAALERNGIKTFIDDRDLETGEDMKDELWKAIKESMFAITVFSPNYASSSWCLDELQHIVECRKNLGLSVVPVFYGVEPWHVRHQKESFGEAFKKQEDRFGQNSEKVTGWRNALAKLANLGGKDFKDEHEATLVESIAKHIHKKLIPKLPSSTKNLVGIASRVEEVMRHIGIGLNDVRFIGIWGRGGIGKTTIAKAIYNAILGEFEVCCFLADIRVARKSNLIVDKQKQLLAKANISVITSDNEHDIQITIETFLCKKKVLLVLDDVSHVIELKKLAGEKDWFGSGSRIIITTRDKQLLEICKVHGTYEVQGLVKSESFDLFCLNAFKQKMHDEKYLNLAREVVEYSGGLPLALEVWGSHLCGRSVDFWLDTIETIKNTQFDQLEDSFKISYESLNVMEKNIFLDIACFFEGEETDYVIDVLNKCGYKAKIGIDILIDRSLVKINESNVLKMHDLLQDMGRNIVIQKSPNAPGTQSRLWSEEVIDRVLHNKEGSKAIEGIVLRPIWHGLVAGFSRLGRHWSAEAFKDMTQLKLLIIHSGDDLCNLSSLPTSLKVLHWPGFPLKTLPLSDRQYELVEINLRDSKIEQLWQGQKFLGKLKHLDLSNSLQLKQTPDLSEVPILETLVLEWCQSLTKVHPSVLQHKSLTVLNLRCCKILKPLPDVGGGLRLLRTLNLSECNLTDKSFPSDFGHFPSLTQLDLSGNAFVRIPINFHHTPKLERLKLNYCPQLECLPELPSSIRELEAYKCDSLNISAFNILSNVRGAFVSPIEDPSQVLLEMVIPGSEIPKWFDHKKDGNSISISPQNERWLGIALCFLLTFDKPVRAVTVEEVVEFALVVRDGNNRFNTNRTAPMHYTDKNLYIICLSKDYFSDAFHQGTCFEFELSILHKDYFSLDELVTSAARPVSSKDIKNLKKLIDPQK